MKYRLPHFAVLCLFYAFALIGAQGCATTPPDPVQRLKAATESATFTINTIANARDAGLLTQPEIDRYKPAVMAFLAAQAEAERQIRAGQSDTVQNALAQVEAAAVPLQPLLTLINQRKAGAK